MINQARQPLPYRREPRHLPCQQPIPLPHRCHSILNQPMQLVTPQFRSPQFQFAVSKPSWVVRERQQGLGALHPMLFEHLAAFHRLPLIVHGPQQQVLDDAAAKKRTPYPRPRLLPALRFAGLDRIHTAPSSR